jgi:RNA polymerase sigma factor for flagellar operon FliA
VGNQEHSAATRSHADADRVFLLSQGLVRTIAWRIHCRVPCSVELDDLVAYGQIGLLEALQRFDKDRGMKFATFAWHRIRGAILDGLTKMNWFDRVSFEKGLYEQPSDAMPAGDSLDRCVKRRPQRCSFTEELHAAFEDPPSVAIEKREAIAVLMAAVADLPEREANLLRGVFFEGRTLSESAKRVGVSTAWASRLQNRTLADLRTALEQYGFGEEPGRLNAS